MSPTLRSDSNAATTQDWPEAGAILVVGAGIVGAHIALELVLGREPVVDPAPFRANRY